MAEPDRTPPSLLARLRRAFGAPDRPVNGVRAPLEPGERERIEAARARRVNVARFETLQVVDVMVPRADIAAVEVSTPLPEVMRIFAEEGHSRTPVYRDTLDDPLGMVHIRDVLPYILGDRTSPEADAPVLGRILRPLFYVPPSMPASRLLIKMQRKRIHMALVVDEFGGTDGLVTLEDLVEEIIGEIEDEHDETEGAAIVARGAASWEATARAEIGALEAIVRRSLTPEDLVAEEIDTLGGLVFALAGRVPERGEVIRHPAGLDFEVVDADPRRIKRLIVRMTRPDPEAADPPGPNS